MAVSGKIALSTYTGALDICNKQRYLEKINSINIDSYTLPSHEVEERRPVQYSVMIFSII